MRAIPVIGILLLLGVQAWAQSPADARKEYKLGRKAEKQGRLFDAWTHYAAARAANPNDLDAIRGFEALRIIAAQTLAAGGDLEAAEKLDQRRDYRYEEAPLAVVEPQRAKPRQITEPVQLKPENIRADFAFQGKAGAAYEALGELFGLRVILDEDFNGNEEIKAELEFTDFAHAVVLLNDLSGAFIAPITTNLFLVAEDTQAKRQQLDPVAAVSISIPEAMTAEETNEIVQAVQQTLDMKRSFVSASAQQVVLRDSVRKIRIAQELYRHLSQPKGEVMIEVELISVSSDRRVQAGVTLPTALPVTNFSTIWNAQAPDLTTDDATRLLAIGGGRTVFGVTIGSAGLAAVLSQRGQSQSLQSFRLRAADGMPAELLIGERFPIVNASFQATATGQDGELSGVPVPSFTFEDLGLTFRATPTIHGSREISLLIETEFKLLAGGTNNGVPILANRAFQTQVRLDEGETAVVSGISVVEARKSSSGPAGLAELPFIGKLFRSNTVQMNESDLLLTITPRLVRLPGSQTERPLEIRFGPEERPLPAL